MKKITASLIISLFLILSPLAAPLAQASAPTDNLQTFLTDNNSSATVQGIQQLLALKQKLEQGKQAEVIAQVKQQVQQAASGLLAKQGLPANQIPAVGSVTSVLQTGVHDQITQEISSRLQPYQTQLQAIGQLLGQNSLLSQSPLQPAAVAANKPLASAPNDSSKIPDNYSKILDIKATAYGPGTADNGHWGDKDYFGNPLQPGVVAVDPNVIAMGTKLWIPGYGYGVANDQGSAIKGNRVDLFFADRQAALDYGIQDVKVYVL